MVAKVQRQMPCRLPRRAGEEGYHDAILQNGSNEFGSRLHTLQAKDLRSVPRYFFFFTVELESSTNIVVWQMERYPVQFHPDLRHGGVQNKAPFTFDLQFRDAKEP